MFASGENVEAVEPVCVQANSRGQLTRLWVPYLHRLLGKIDPMGHVADISHQRLRH